MTEKQAEQMLQKLASIEKVLMHIANNTSDSVPPHARSGMRTYFYTEPPIITTSAPQGPTMTSNKS